MVFSAWAGPVTAVGLHLVYVLFLYFGDVAPCRKQLTAQVPGADNSMVVRALLGDGDI